MNVLMVGVSADRVGGMWTVAKSYINSREYNEKTHLSYIATSTNGSALKRMLCMLKGYHKARHILRSGRTDIVHLHMAEKGSTYRKGVLAKWGKQAKARVIIHLHAGPFMAWFHSLSDYRQKKVIKILNYADCVVVLGEYWKRELKSIIPEHKISVLYNGVVCPQQNNYRIQAKNIVYFGVMRKEKGIYDLLEALSEIDHRLDPKTKVILCGTDLTGEIENVIEGYHLKGRVILTGWIGEEARQKVFSEAMLDILPSYYEGLSMSVIEAMAYGIPVLTTNISTMPELLGEEARLIEPGDIKGLSERILELAENGEERIRLSDSQYRRAVSLFSEDKFIKNTLQLYEQLLLKTAQRMTPE